MAKIRKPAAAGQFYDASDINLIQTLKESFLDSRGPRTLPEIKKGNKDIKGVVVPHAGYIYSGAIAAHSYHTIAGNGFADTFIILGPNHTGMGSGVSVMTEGAWETPLGEAPINNELAELLCTSMIDKDEKAHLYEHSIEVQIPFLQYSANDKAFDFVPICMGTQDYYTSIKVGEIIAEAIKRINKKIIIVASSDFTHAGFNYMSMPPPGMRVDQYAEKQDQIVIEEILRLDPKGVIDAVQQKNISMCGYGPVAAMITAAKIQGAKTAELLKYSTSYDVQPSDSCVGYGSIIIY